MSSLLYKRCLYMKFVTFGALGRGNGKFTSQIKMRKEWITRIGKVKILRFLWMVNVVFIRITWLRTIIPSITIDKNQYKLIRISCFYRYLNNHIYGVLNIFTFSSSEQSPQYKRKIIGHFQHLRIHCTRWVKYGSLFSSQKKKKRKEKKKRYGSTWELLINVDP